MVPSLTELCHMNIAESIYTAPPMIQEMIIDDTKDRMKKRIKKDLEPEIEKRAEKKAEEKIKTLAETTSVQMGNIYASLIPEVITDMVRAATTGVMRTDYYEYYTAMGYPRDMIRDLIDASETIANVCILTRIETGDDNFDAWAPEQAAPDMF